MKVRRARLLLSCLLIVSMTELAVPSGYSQEALPSGAATTDLVRQLAAVFSEGRVVQRVQLSGSATWYAGTLQASGTVNLTAAADGTSQMQLALEKIGARTESHAGIGMSATCQWTGDDGLSHQILSGDCWRPVVWFLPTLLLQPSVFSSDEKMTDLGLTTVGAGSVMYRHLQSQLTFSNVQGKSSAELAALGSADYGLDPETLLPVVLSYSTLPDNGAAIPVAIEVHYSDYRTIDGSRIPFHIQRYVNSALQLDILVNSAQLN